MLKLQRKTVVKKIYGIATLTVALIAMTLLVGRSHKVVVAASVPPTGIENVVLVHGTFADASGREAVAKILEKDGYTVSVAQPSETFYVNEVKYTKAAIDAMGGPADLDGYSRGGAIISEAGNGSNVAALVYIAAACAADISPAESHCMAISQVPNATDSFTHKVTSSAWKTKPTWYMVATADRSINPDEERMMAKRANRKTLEVNASPVAYMSHPKEMAKLIEDAAASAHVNE
jgi:hypothetical protein